MDSVLSLCNISVGYDGKEILSDVNFALSQGEIAVLIGANGSGKSTLLKTIAGVSLPLHGTIEIAGAPLGTYRRRKLAALLAVVFTDRSGGGDLTVEECVSLGRLPYTGPLRRLDDSDHALIMSAIKAVGLQDKITRKLATLSDGERQKTMIARALAQQSKLIILDEPTAFLDVAGRYEIMALLRRLASDGHSIILSTHDIAPAIAVADKLLVIDKSVGSLFAGSKSEIIASGAIDRAFTGSNLKFDPVKGDFTLRFPE